MDRDRSIDNLKGLLISLVVLGHAVGAACHISPASDQAFYALLYKIIYAFHMPAFFFVAGALYKERICVWAFVQKRFMRLLVPYFLFGIAFIVLFSLFAKGLTPSTAHYTTRQVSSIWALLLELLYGGSYSGQPAFAYNSVLWFLPTLFSLEVLYCALNGLRLKARRISVPAFDAILFIVCFGLTWLFRTYPLPNLPYGLALVPYYMLFYVVGKSICLPCRLAWLQARRWGWLPSLVLLTGVCLACHAAPPQYMAYFSFKWYIIYFIIALTGVLGIAALAPYLHLKFWAACGFATMSIMLLHKPILVVLQFAIPSIRKLYGVNLAVGLMVSLVASLIAIGFCLVADRILKKYLPEAIGERRSRP